MPFEFNVEQAYILEFGPLYFRIYKDGGQVESGGFPVEVTTVYTADDLDTLKFAQAADTMYVVSPNHPVYKITRTSHTAWTITEAELTRGPMLDPNTTTTTLTASARDGQITITASANTFVSTDAGRLVKIQDGYAKITAKVDISGTSSNNKTSALVVDVTDTVMTFAPGIDLAAETTSSTIAGTLEAVDDWSLGAFSDTTGYPRAVTFYEQRLVFAGTDEQPQTLFFSQSGDFENFELGAEDDDGMIYTIGSNEVNVIRFLTSTRNLIVGTSGGEFVVRAGGTDEAITPTNVQIKQQTNHGSSDHTPVQAGTAVLFIQRAKRKIHELQYNFDVDGYIAPDVSLISEHITESGLTELAYQQEPDSVIWGVRGDGELACMTYKREEQIIGWSRQIIGGSFGTGGAVVERVASIPGDLDEDEIYMVVKRTVNGATKRYIEYIKDFDFGTDVYDAIFVDSALSFTGVTTTLNGDISNSATTITLTDATDFPSSGQVKIGSEIITYSGKSSNDLTGCTRGVSGTAAAHTSG
ncbi:MAG: hypothetical protein EBU35_09235, partial [Marivivens sp.]|nr:hypothetical protein [Marivivens sp.]